MSTTDRYRVMMDRDRFKLKQLHDTWLRYTEIVNIPKGDLCVVRSILGQTQLLIRKKFGCMDSFLKRVDKQPELDVTEDDLRGLWDTVRIEVDDLLAKYKEIKNKLESTSDSQSPEIAKKLTPQRVQKHPDKGSVLKTNKYSRPSNPPNLSSTKHAPTENVSSRATKSLTKPVKTKLSSTRRGTSVSKPIPTESSCAENICPKPITTEKKIDTPSSPHNISSMKTLKIETFMCTAIACVRTDIIRPKLTSYHSCETSVSSESSTSCVVTSFSSVTLIPLKAVPSQICLNSTCQQKPIVIAPTSAVSSDNIEEASNFDADDYFDAQSSLGDL